MAYMDNVLQQYSKSELTVLEDLQEVISIIDPVELPLLSTLEHVPVTQRQFDWPMDSIDRMTGIDDTELAVHPEGDDAAFETPTYRNRVFNVCQINARSIDVTDTMRATLIGGVEDEFRYQAWRHLIGLGTEMEMSLHWGLQRANEGTQASQTIARSTQGIVPWIIETGWARSTSASSVTLNGGVAGLGQTVVKSPFYSVFYQGGIDNADVTLTKNILYDNILGEWWKIGGNVNNSLCLVGSALKRAITNLVIVSGSLATNHRNIPAEMRAIIDCVDMVETELGYIWLCLDRYMDADNAASKGILNRLINRSSVGVADVWTMVAHKTIAIIEPRYWKVGVLRPIGFQPLAKVGDSSKGQIVGEWGLLALNPKAGCGGGNLIPA